VFTAAGRRGSRLPTAERLPTLSLHSGDSSGEAPSFDESQALELLRTGAIEITGRLVDASNVTLLAEISTDDAIAECVYKPIAGERPLWDFPDGTLAGREVATYLVSAATGWDVVPPTVLRDGPFGPGMVQLWMDGDPTIDLLELARSDRPALRRMAVLDVVVNNADRKGGHLIPMPDGHVYGVDHGICFSSQPKLRTLLWRWAGRPLPEEAVEVLERLSSELFGELGAALEDHLTVNEVTQTHRRVATLLNTGIHPEPSGEWPALPWPPI